MTGYSNFSSNKIKENMSALLIIDMQKGSFTNKTPRYNTKSVVARINDLSTLFRKMRMPVVIIQHDGRGTGEFEKHSVEWQNLDELTIEPTDVLIDKYANDAFYKTDLQNKLDELAVDQVIVTGCATDFCIESTIQSALSKNYNVLIIEDGHTTADRPHLKADKVIEHYNWVWRHMLPTQGNIGVEKAEIVKSRYFAGI
ncbi:cysteine hydrolase family protein [Sphingobacterium faecium]|uniref:cysteine hydrolase family protein n=1 Tax=Sphingobacterium faecium TaxID=34087 RepID=UPI00320884B9